jgi:F-type H+-transporting ATPase subunit gamma
LVPFTSDKGLCGGVNSGIVRDVRAKIRANRNGFKLFIIGEKVSFNYLFL